MYGYTKYTIDAVRMGLMSTVVVPLVILAVPAFTLPLKLMRGVRKL